MESVTLNTTTEALDPGEETKLGISQEEEDVTQHVESNVKMGVVDRMRMGDNFVISTHDPKGSHTTARNDELEQKTDVEAAMDHPDELPQIGPRVSMSCTHVLCVFKTDYWPRKVAMKKLYNHRRKKHPRDRNDNPKEDMREMSDLAKPCA